MKKLLFTILFTLVLSGGAYATTLKYECTTSDAKYDYVNWEFNFDQNYVMEEASTESFGGKYYPPERSKILSYDEKSVRLEYRDKKNKAYISEFNYATDQTHRNISAKKTLRFNCKYDKEKLNNFLQSRFGNNNNTSNTDISFNIKQKKEQCEVIGFKPETEKFADCVLRLVELDVKQQTQNQITVAQNNGNDALVKQLERQNNLQSSQALINLGQQLMNPKQYNSNIYMPQTRRCTVSGFGATSVVRCY
jgi:hypothetical protein